MMVGTDIGTRMRVRMGDAIGSSIALYGVWEPGITNYVRETLKRGDIFIDIGANIGYYTLLASSLVGPYGRVHAIEPSHSIGERLRENLALNRCGNVTVHPYAVSNTTGEVPIFLHDATNLGHTTIVASVAGAHHRVEKMVEARRLGDIVPVEDIRSARLIKIDVEGAEWLVFQGMKDLLAEMSAGTEILMEVRPDTLEEMGTSITRLLEEFRVAAFVPYLLPDTCWRKPLRPFEGALTARADLLFRRKTAEIITL